MAGDVGTSLTIEAPMLAQVGELSVPMSSRPIASQSR